MPQSLAKIYVHIIFATKGRSPYLSDGIRPELHAYMAKVLKECDSPPVIIGSVEDHVHILCALSKNFPVSKVVEEVKKSSSKWMKTKGKLLDNFHWQNGYGAFSVSPSKLEDVKSYIRSQEDHHRRISFQEEFRRFLEQYKVDYDERYVWD